MTKRESIKSKSTKTRKELEVEIAALKASMPEPLTVPRIFVTDSTPESLQNLLAEQGGRVAVLTDEGNLFDIISGMYSNGKANLDVFLQGHAAGTLRVKRKDREVNLQRIAVTLGIAAQPQVLGDIRAANKRSLRGKGALARFVFCVPKSNIGQRNVRHRSSIEPGILENYFRGIKELLNTPADLGEDREEKARMVTLSDPAREVWEDFSQWIEDRQGEGGEFDDLQDFTGKLPGTALRISALCKLAENALSALSPLSNKHEVQADTMIGVVKLCKSLIVHARAAFDLLESDECSADARRVLSWIKSHVSQDQAGAYWLKEHDLQRAVRFPKDRLSKALEMLHTRNIISTQQKLPTQKPTLVRYVNPAICDQMESDRLRSA